MAAKRRRKLPTFLSDREVDALLRATTTQRDRLILFLMRFIGLRVSEVSKLRIEHIDFGAAGGPTLFVREGKGMKDRALPIPRAVASPLRGWIGPRADGPVFPSSRGGALKVRAIQLLVKRLAVRAGIRAATEHRRATPHKFRHAFATKMLERGADINSVREALGHSSIQTTQIYLHTDPSRLRGFIEL